MPKKLDKEAERRRKRAEQARMRRARRSAEMRVSQQTQNSLNRKKFLVPKIEERTVDREQEAEIVNNGDDIPKTIKLDKDAETRLRKAEQARIRRAKQSTEMRILQQAKNSLNRTMRLETETEEKRAARLERQAEVARQNRAKKAKEAGRFVAPQTARKVTLRRTEETEEQRAFRLTQEALAESRTLSDDATKNSNIGNEIKDMKVWVVALKKAAIACIKHHVDLTVENINRKKGLKPRTEKKLKETRQKERKRVWNRNFFQEKMHENKGLLENESLEKQLMQSEKKRLYHRMSRVHELAKERQNMQGVVGIPIRLIDDFSNSSADSSANKILVCIVCEKQFNSLQGLMTHTSHHSVLEISAAKERDSIAKGENRDSSTEQVQTFVPRLNCEVCPDSFISVSRYRKHLIDEHSDNKELLKDVCFFCTICKEAFTHRRGLAHHLKNFHEIFNQCPICSDNIKTQELFTQHLKESHADKYNSKSGTVECSEGYLCIICGLTNGSSRTLANHYKNKHSEHKSFPCDICGQRFGVKKVLENHIFNVHQQKSHCCDICGKQFTTSTKFNNHMKKHDELYEKPTVECNICKRKLGSAASLRVHKLAVHREEKSFQCHICGMDFSCMSSLHIHKTILCEKEKALKSTCPICGKTFENYVFLRYHKANIHKYGNTEEDVCHLCNKKYRNSQCLLSHNNIYHRLETTRKELRTGNIIQEQEIKCVICAKVFPHRRFAMDHWRTHKQERPYTCSLCPEATFKQHQGFYLHKKFKHKNDQEIPMLLVDKECNQKLTEEFEKAHAPQFSQLRRRRANVNVQINSTPETTVEANQVTSTLQLDTSVTRSELDDGAPLNYRELDESGISDTVSITQCNLETAETSLDTRSTLGDTDSEKRIYPVESSCLTQLDEVAKEVAEKRVRLENNFLDLMKLTASSEDPVDIDDIIAKAVLENSDCKNDERSAENLQEFSNEDTLPKETNESQNAMEDHDDSDSAQCQFSPLSNYHDAESEVEIEVDNEDVKPLVDDIIPHKLFSGDPFQVQLIVVVEKLKEYPCSLCDNVFHHFKFYKKHLNTRTHRTAARLNSQKVVLKLKSELKLRTKTADIPVVSKSKESHKNKGAIKEDGYKNKELVKNEDDPKNKVVKKEDDHKNKVIKKEDGRTSFPCDYCGKYYASRVSLCNHRRSHIYKIDCEQCGKTFVRKFDYQKHVKHAHLEGEFSCRICYKDFKEKKDLELHVLEHKEGETVKRMYIKRNLQKEKVNKDSETLCDICGKVFLTERKMLVHRVRHGEKSFKCDSCPSAFSFSYALRLHVDSVHLKKKVLCPECGKMYSSKTVLQEHMLIHKGTPRTDKRRKDYKRIYKCDFEKCEQTFRNRQSFRRHMDKHLGIKITCEYCGKQFLNSISMYKHKKSHRTSQYNFCSICSLSFTKQDGYNRHVQSIHDPSRPFPCDQCYSFFKYRSNLTHHKKNAHLKLGIVYKKKKKIKPAPTEAETPAVQS